MNRYSSYSKLPLKWMEEIPSHWIYTKNRFGFKKWKNGKNESDDTPVLSLTIKGIKIKKDLSFGKSTESYIGHQLVEKGDIVFTPRDFDQTPILSDVSKYDGCISNLYIVDKTNDGVLNKYVNYYWYGLKYSVNYFKNFSHGIRFSFNRFQFDEIPLLIPPLPEQTQIVSFLDTKTQKIDELIEKTEQKIELLKEKRTSLINHCVTKGLNTDVEMKDSGVEWIGEIPSHWEKIKLHTLVTSQKLEFQDGNHGGLHPIPEEFLEIGVPFIKPKDIQKEKVLWDSCDRLPFERCEQFRIGFSNNDDVLLVNRGGSIGKVVYVSDYDNEFPYFVINPQVTYLRGKNGLLSKYIFYISVSDIFQCGIDLIMGHGSTFPFLGLSNMGDFEIVFPDMSEQQQIVEYLDEQTQLMDNTISIEEKRIELLKEYRQSLISEVVTGKRKVV